MISNNSPLALLFIGVVSWFSFSSFSYRSPYADGHTLTVETHGLRNNQGWVVFALYNHKDALPDEHYKKVYKKITAKVVNGSATAQFDNLPTGSYAVKVLHDENTNYKIDRGLFLPREGIGFSNYTSIGPGNKPQFKKASFPLSKDLKIQVKMIYL